MAILAGIMIAIGCVCYILVGGIGGAALFSIGLMTVCLYQLPLFTG